jgi:hypothetical protein
MGAQRHPAVLAAARLRQALEQSAAALATGSLDALLAVEDSLRHASINLPFPSSDLPDDQRRALRAELDDARLALERCRRLGVNLTEFVRLSLHAHGGAVGYDPQQSAAAALTGRRLNAKG